MYNQGDIVLLPFPYSDLSGAKQRPALVISNNVINKSEDRICCLVTSNKPREGLIIEKKDFKEGNLPFKSWVKPHRLFTTHERTIRKKVCTINSDFNKRVVKRINFYLASD